MTSQAAKHVRDVADSIVVAYDYDDVDVGDFDPPLPLYTSGRFTRSDGLRYCIDGNGFFRADVLDDPDPYSDPIVLEGRSSGRPAIDPARLWYGRRLIEGDGMDPIDYPYERYYREGKVHQVAAALYTMADQLQPTGYTDLVYDPQTRAVYDARTGDRVLGIGWDDDRGEIVSDQNYLDRLGRPPTPEELGPMPMSRPSTVDLGLPSSMYIMGGVDGDSSSDSQQEAPEAWTPDADGGSDDASSDNSDDSSYVDAWIDPPYGQLDVLDDDDAIGEIYETIEGGDEERTRHQPTRHPSRRAKRIIESAGRKILTNSDDYPAPVARHYEQCWYGVDDPEDLVVMQARLLEEAGDRAEESAGYEYEAIDLDVERVDPLPEIDRYDLAVDPDSETIDRLVAIKRERMADRRRRLDRADQPLSLSAVVGAISGIIALGVQAWNAIADVKDDVDRWTEGDGDADPAGYLFKGGTSIGPLRTEAGVDITIEMPDDDGGPFRAYVDDSDAYIIRHPAPASLPAGVSKAEALEGKIRRAVHGGDGTDGSMGYLFDPDSDLRSGAGDSSSDSSDNDSSGAGDSSSDSSDNNSDAPPSADPQTAARDLKRGGEMQRPTDANPFDADDEWEWWDDDSSDNSSDDSSSGSDDSSSDSSGGGPFGFGADQHDPPASGQKRGDDLPAPHRPDAPDKSRPGMPDVSMASSSAWQWVMWLVTFFRSDYGSKIFQWVTEWMGYERLRHPTDDDERYLDREEAALVAMDLDEEMAEVLYLFEAGFDYPIGLSEEQSEIFRLLKLSQSAHHPDKDEILRRNWSDDDRRARLLSVVSS